MNAEKIHKEVSSRIIQLNGRKNDFVDKRPQNIAQADMISVIQQKEGRKSELLKNVRHGIDYSHSYVTDKVRMFNSLSPLVQLQSAKVIQRIMPNDLPPKDLEQLVKFVREGIYDLLYDWEHIKKRHFLKEGIEEGEIVEDYNSEHSYFESSKFEDVKRLIYETIQNGKYFWSETGGKIWFKHNFGKRIGGYADGTPAFIIEVYINTFEMEKIEDVSKAWVTTAFPRCT